MLRSSFVLFLLLTWFWLNLSCALFYFIFAAIFFLDNFSNNFYVYLHVDISYLFCFTSRLSFFSLSQRLPSIPPYLTRWFWNHESRLKIHQSMWIQWPFLQTWNKGHWPLDDLWPHICWGLMCDSTQGSLCPSPVKIHQSMWIQWPVLKKTWSKGHWP